MVILILPDFHSNVPLVPEYDLVDANLRNHWHALTWLQQYGREGAGLLKNLQYIVLLF
jgi:hypothetical protein